MKLTKKLKTRLGLAARMAAVMTIGALGLARAPVAYADEVLLKAATTLVYGSSSDTYSMTAPSAGTITAQVSGFQWPASLSALSFNMSDASNIINPETLSSAQAVHASDTTGSQFETYQVGAGTYFAHVLATAGGSLNLGLYSVMFTFTPSAVPLPATAGMFLFGVMVFFALRRTLRQGATIEASTFGASA
jgi:hypothetical protein